MSQSRAAVPDRARWALEVLEFRPADHVLEIGCGPGVAAELVCERLDTGSLLAVDRSSVAVNRTVQRNAAHVAAGRLVVRQASLDDLDLPPAELDEVFSINVNLFWTKDPARELDLLRRAMRPGAKLHLLYGAAEPAGADRVTKAVAENLSRHGFNDVVTISGPGGIGVSARRP